MTVPVTMSHNTPAARRITREDLVNRHEAAAILGVHPNTIDNMGKSATLRRFRIRGVRGAFYLRTEVESCIEEETS